MSNPNIPNITPTISISLAETVPLLLSSIALEELALAHLLNAEGEKLQFILGTLTPTRTTFSPATVSLENLLAANTSVQRTLRDVINKEMLLEFKFENTLDLAAIVASHGPFKFNFIGAKLQFITVPPSATTATIQAIGAAGGAGTAANGLGASIQGEFPVMPGEVLSILVGGQGGTGNGPKADTASGGGGGGSFVWRGTGDLTLENLLVAAGGGGGASFKKPGVNASTGSGGTDGNPGGAGGSDGSGGLAFSEGGGGGGILTSGADTLFAPSGGGQAISAGGAGGIGENGIPTGGFGGGGGDTAYGGGGGGGFSGGGGGGILQSAGGGGGGGSQNNGTKQVNTAGVGTGNGLVTIQFSGL